VDFGREEGGGEGEDDLIGTLGYVEEEGVESVVAETFDDD
jgi:hypothetical protein